MKPVSKVGRPRGYRDNRTKLITAAKQLFVAHDYDKVSLREIAKSAQVDSALIGYYFQSKFGLFMAMLKETAAPITEQLSKSESLVSEQSCGVLMTTYYRVMSENPDFPKLIFKIASMPNTDKTIDFKKILNQILPQKYIKLFTSMHEQGFLQDGVDPLCAQISFFSMMVFPFLIPDVFKQAMGIEISPEFMLKLGQQNANLLRYGCLTTSGISALEGDHYE